MACVQLLIGVGHLLWTPDDADASSWLPWENLGVEVWKGFLIALMIIPVMVAERDSFQQPSQEDSAK